MELHRVQMLAAQLVLIAAAGCSDGATTGSTATGGAAAGGAGGGAVGGTGGAGAATGCEGGAAALADGETLTLCGQGFGSKPTAQPLRYDDFESGQPDELLQDWNHYGNTSVVPVYGDQHAYAGQQSAFIDLPEGTYSNGAYLSNLALVEIYFSYRVYVIDGGGSDPDPHQVKFGRVTSAAVDVVHGSPGIGMTVGGTLQDGNGMWYNGGSAENETFYGHRPPLGQWARIEHYLKLSSPAGTANGKRWAKLNHQGSMTFSSFPGGHFADPYATGIDPDAYDGADLVTLTDDADAEVLNNVLLPFFTRTGQIVSIWVDEVYVDSTQARVELGDAPVWSDCTSRSPQPPLAWADAEVTVRLNQGTLSGDAYAFVVTTEGEIIELGRVGAWL